jgi:hypothetical protein
VEYLNLETKTQTYFLQKTHLLVSRVCVDIWWCAVLWYKSDSYSALLPLMYLWALANYRFVKKRSRNVNVGAELALNSKSFTCAFDICSNR